MPFTDEFLRRHNDDDCGGCREDDDKTERIEERGYEYEEEEYKNCTKYTATNL